MTGFCDSIDSVLKEALESVPVELHSDFRKHFSDVSAFNSEVEKAPTEDEDAREDAQQACALFVARELTWMLTNGPRSHIGLPISALVSYARTNPFEFFRELPVTLNQIQPFLVSRGTSSKALLEDANVERWSHALLFAHVLSGKYKDTLSRQMVHLSALRPMVIKLGWMMFLVAKACVLPPFADLVSCVELLIAVINILVANSPTLPQILKSWGGEGNVGSTLEMLSGMLTGSTQVAKADMEHVKAIASSLTSFLENFIAQVPGISPGTHETSGVITYCNSYEGLLTDADVINTWTEALEKQYEKLFASHFELDEREYLHTNLSMFASPMHSPAATYSLSSAKRPHGLSPLGPGSFTKLMGSSPLMSPNSDQSHPTLLYGANQSPVPRMRLGLTTDGGPTPITRAMQAAQWLRSVVGTSSCSNSSEPIPVPASLARYLELANAGLEQGLATQVHQVMQGVWPSQSAEQQQSSGGPACAPSGGTPDSEHRVQAIKLYYHTLEIVLAAEAQSNSSSFAQLMGSSTFHRGLLACCVEAVIGAHQMPLFEFPYALRPLKLKAFDLLKIVQPFVKALPAMPRELKRHMFLIEEKVIQSLAWEAGSSLYPLIMSVVRACPSSDTHGRPNLPESESYQLSEVAAGSLSALSLGPSGDVEDDGSSVSPRGNNVGGKRDTPHAAIPSLASSPAKRMCPASTREPAAAAAPAPAPSYAEPSTISEAERSEWSHGSLPGAIGRISLSSVPREAKAKVAILVEFLRKVLKLCAFRLSLLLGDSHIARDMMPMDAREVHRQVMEALEEILYHHTHLFYNRHIDQLILCTFYGFCKSHQLGLVTLKKIITQYRRQVKVSHSTLASVILKQSLCPEFEVSARGDLYAFYNKTFLPAVCSSSSRWRSSRAAWMASPKPGPVGLPPRAPPQPLRSSIMSPVSSSAGCNSSGSTLGGGGAAGGGAVSSLQTAPQPPKHAASPSGGGHTSVEMNGCVTAGVQRFFPSLKTIGSPKVDGVSEEAGSSSQWPAKANCNAPAQSPRQMLMPPPPPRPPSALNVKIDSAEPAMPSRIPNGLAALLHAVDSS